MLNYNDIINFEGLYKISKSGKIINKHNKILKTYIINSGYECVKLHDHKHNRHSFLVHRLVAQTYLKNVYNKEEVNHIDGNKLNNNIANLAWVSSSENKIHKFETGLSIYNQPSKGIKLGKSSKFYNVCWDKNRNKWIGSIRYNNKTFGQKRFDNETDAALHVNNLLHLLNITDRPKNIII